MSFSSAFAHAETPHDRDRATLSNYRAVRTTHLDLVWAIDWARKLIGGSATLDLEATEEIDEVVLDTSYLDIRGVTVGGLKADYVKDERIGAMGEALHVKLPKAAQKGDEVTIAIDYSTTEECTTVGWLEPGQTKSGKHPYLYSQSQAIHGRSLFPCQDTPAIKATYTSRVTSTLPVLMSGLRQSPPPSAPLELGKEVEYTYKQPVAIPSYLVAIASGEVAYRPFKDLEGRAWRTGVWAEPGQMDEAYWEFEEDTAKQVAAAEDLTSDYRFGVYDFLILPKSFPYGGMENCCLTFATPTLLAHDRSLVDVIAHEISHSWFGNSIGCASWSHFWLNEGWTTYLERLIMRRLEGEAARQLSFIIGRSLLRGSLEENKDKPRFQRLLPDYEEHEDPDEGYSQVPYEKGANFLLYLERLVGGVDVFVPYMKSYVEAFTDSAITTDQWRAHLFHYFGGIENGDEIVKKLAKIDWDAWLHGSGLDLAVDVEYDDALARPPLDLATRWIASKAAHDLTPFSPRDIADFSSTQLCVFLDKLDEVVFESRVVKALDDVYKIGKSGNAEIALRFYKVALKAGPEYADVAAEWVTDKGRMKFNRPIYRLLCKQAPELARKTFEAHRSFYHPIARKMIAKDLGVEA